MAVKKMKISIEDRIEKLSQLANSNDVIANELFEKHKVFRGLRDNNGVGVVTGLTEISEINAFRKDEEGNRIPIEGELFYRGVNIYELVSGYKKERRYGFEETAYLLLCGKLPTEKELEEFNELLLINRDLPDSFVRDVILKAPPKDMMNALSRCILTLYSYDANADDTTIKNVFKQTLQLIALTPIIAVYSYQAYKHYHERKNLVIRYPKPELSIAENILYMLKGTGKYTKEQAYMLDICLILHAEHGGGNNSTFTTHVVTSSGTDTYSAISASLGSLKGPKHGGANIKVVQMFEDIKNNLTDFSDEAICDYLAKLLDKEAFDNSGLIYGMGHAIYSLSDPRANILHSCVKEYVDKGQCKDEEDDKDYVLYEKIAELGPKVILNRRKLFKDLSVNVDYYSGFLYKLLRIPEELFTPIFAIARMAGWTAHRLEELTNKGKIIRPAYIAVAERQEYVDIKDRK
ncbi:MAG: citrate synthase [Clostridia bacterium]|nr:citrate synthase [Clostridia bacterium]